MPPVLVKVCGLRSEADVEACVGAGVDWVGFNFWPRSKRYIDPARAAALVRLLPSGVRPVGVFVNASPGEVRAVVDAVGLTMAQLHGDEAWSEYAGLGVELLPVLRVRDEGSMAGEVSLPDGARMLLLDAHVEGYGGEGRSFDWTLVPGGRRRLGVATLLIAGGLRSDNVGEAVRMARPDGVDVASGVEGLDGFKDASRVRAFVRAARERRSTDDDEGGLCQH